MNGLRNIKNAPASHRLFSAPASRLGQPSIKGKVDREKRIIPGFAVASKGEALGHDQWLDEVFLDQLVNAGQSAKSGLKSRFGHPGMSTDNTGRSLGRVTNFYLDGKVVRGDMKILDSAKKEWADHVLGIAEEAPDIVGTSIVFCMDLKSMQEFESQNQVEKSADEFAGDKQAARRRGYDEERVPRTKFKSPDPENINNYPHVRLKEFRAVDFVDDPAANPSGFFGQKEEDILSKGEALCAFIFGETDEFDEAEAEEFLGVHPERIRRFVEAHLDAHKLQIVPISAQEDSRSVLNPADKTAGNLNKGVPPMATREELLKDLKDNHGVDYEGLAPALTLLGVDPKNGAAAVGVAQNLLNKGAKADALEAEMGEAKAGRRVDKLIAEFRVQPAHRDVWLGQARKLDDASWDALAATLNPAKGTSKPKEATQLSTGNSGNPPGDSGESYDLGDGTTEDKTAYAERMKSLVNSKARTGGNGAGIPMPGIELQKL